MAKKNNMEQYEFSKAELLAAHRYRERRDMLNALLKEDKKYSHEDVKRLIDEFKKGKVK